MVSSIVSSIVFGFLSVVVGQQEEKPKWSYGATELGPDNWAVLFPDQCAGHFQSPVDICTHKTVYNPSLEEFVFSSAAHESKFVVQNNAHTIEVETEGEFFLLGGGLSHEHKVVQFHFHWGDYSLRGSEHTIDGVAYPIELHIVSWNTKYGSMKEALRYRDGLAVLGVLYLVTEYDNPDLEPVIQAIPHVQVPDLKERFEIEAFSLQNLVPSDHKFYRYQGSLTTPKCLESVTWTVFDQHMPISERQLNAFRQALTSAEDPNNSPGQGDHVREALVNNYRPVQPLNGRRVFRNFKF